MSENEHTPEPWGINEQMAVVCDSNGENIQGSPSNLQRIVACVNACRGIPDEVLNVVGAFGGFGRDQMVEHVTKQRDELLAMLEKVTAKLAWLNSDDCGHIMALTDEAEATIDRVKGINPVVRNSRTTETAAPAIVFYPAGSLGEEVQS